MFSGIDHTFIFKKFCYKFSKCVSSYKICLKLSGEVKEWRGSKNNSIFLHFIHTFTGASFTPTNENMFLRVEDFKTNKSICLQETHSLLRGRRWQIGKKTLRYTYPFFCLFL